MTASLPQKVSRQDSCNITCPHQKSTPHTITPPIHISIGQAWLLLFLSFSVCVCLFVGAKVWLNFNAKQNKITDSCNCHVQMNNTHFKIRLLWVVWKQLQCIHTHFIYTHFQKQDGYLDFFCRFGGLCVGNGIEWNGVLRNRNDFTCCSVSSKKQINSRKGLRNHSLPLAVQSLTVHLIKCHGPLKQPIVRFRV